MESIKKEKNTVVFDSNILLLAVFFVANLMRSSAYIKSIALFDDLMTLLQFAGIFYIILHRLAAPHKEQLFAPIELCVILLYAAFLISTVLHTHEYKYWTLFFLQALSAVMVGRELMKLPIKKTLSMLRFILSFLMLLNFIGLFIPGIVLPGTENAYRSHGVSLAFLSQSILGYRIAFTPYAILTVFICLLYDRFVLKKRLSWFTIAMFFLLILTAIISTVSALIVILVVFLIGIVFCLTDRDTAFRRLSNYWVFFGLSLVLFLMIVIYARSDFVKPFLSAINEDTTFSGRDVIWSTVIQYITQKPLLGYGTTGTGSFMIYSYYNPRLMPAHNETLNILYQGGLVSLSAFLLTFVVLGIKIDRCAHSQLRRILSLTIFAFFCLMLVEIETQKALLFLIIGMVYQLAEQYSFSACAARILKH